MPLITLISTHLSSPHLTSPRLTSPHLTAPPLQTTEFLTQTGRVETADLPELRFNLARAVSLSIASMAEGVAASSSTAHISEFLSKVG